MPESVAITRGDNGPLINPLQETRWTIDAPAGTRWAFANLNGNPASFNASDHAALNFASFRAFRAAYGGMNPAVYKFDNIFSSLRATTQVIKFQSGL